ncbi:MAG: hypothetical protein HY741_24200 [Chloroflexi bacterium]|nr:hypothetical protein [Chloroflexota bacterium]
MNSFLVRRAALVALLLTFAALFFLSFALAAPNEQGLSCATAPVSADPTPTVCISRVVVIFNGISPDNQFTVSWRTLKNETGQVKLASGETFDDTRGASYQGKTHYIVVSNRDAKKNYSFDIVSGGKTYTNDNAHWTGHTGPAVQPTTPYIVFGRVSNPDGSDADGAIVYAQIRDGDNQGTQSRSAWLSGLIVVADGGNFFNLNLDEARTQSNGQKYTYNPDGDRVFVIAVGAQGTASKAFKISELHPPAPPPSLILSSSGAGSAATATATQLPPTNTPTASPTSSLTPTPVSPTPSQTHTPLAPSPTLETLTETASAEPPAVEPTSTLEPADATRIAQELPPTGIAEPAGEEVEPPRTRIFGGVPTVVPPQQNSNNWILVALAAVLIIGAALLGLAAFFVTRNKN